jgi:hypothetical protein
MITPYFNRPARPIDLDPLFADIRGVSRRLYLASAWLTNTHIAELVAIIRVPEKCVILNAADLQRPGGHAAVDILRQHDPATWDNRLVHVLGSGDWQEGVMHCKFVVADDVVWVGSYNFTWQAQRNYEVLLRIEDQQLADTFVVESRQMIEDWPLWQGSSQFAHSGDGAAFRCAHCAKIVPYTQLGENGGSWMICAACKAKRAGIKSVPI